VSPNEIFWVLVGLASIALTVWLNRHLFRGGLGTSGLEWIYYALGLAALVIGWYFNFAYLRAYGAEAGWWHWTKLLFANPAAASGGQDLVIANCILFPLWTILDGRRDKMPQPWIYFAMSIITSFAFAMAVFLAFQDRQRRFNSPSRP